MKKLIPYFISYLIIAASTAAIVHFSSYPGNSTFFTLHTPLSYDDLVAKLQQVGIPESAVHEARTPAPMATLISIFDTYGVGFGVFLGLALLIERLISKSRP